MSNSKNSSENTAQFDFDSYTSSGINLISAIKVRIDQLAQKELLQTLDKKYKRKFEDRFPKDIPHTDQLPTNVYHNIDIKLGRPISVARAYSCPRKY
jgi:hypothetical protein